MKTKTLLFILLVGMSISLTAQSTWKAPKSADEIKNPITDKALSIKKGKSLYKAQCLMCHGVKGNGKGSVGIALSPKPADFTSNKVQSQTDGALFWKITNGNSPMASYKDILTEEQRWNLVNYLRTFKKN